MGKFNKQGLLNGYKKNNKERAALDYYATPTEEAENILNHLKIDMNNKTILEPCCGGGHMINGIDNYIPDSCLCTRIASDVQDRGYTNDKWVFYYGNDFLDDNYPIESADIVIMNPPYSTIEPFLIRALEIAQEKLVVLCRTQVVEGVGRYNNIFKDNPPTEIYQYVDRISCYKNGEPDTAVSAQAYCWLVWDKLKMKGNYDTIFKWIKRVK